MAGILDKILNVDGRRLKEIEKKIKPVLALEEKYANMSNEELKAETPRFRQLLAEGKTTDDILPEAFATAREACRRVIGEYPYPVQLMGAQSISTRWKARACMSSRSTNTFRSVTRNGWERFTASSD